MRFYYTKLLDTSKEDCQLLEFINPVVDSDDEDDDIFEPERSFPGVFNAFVNQWYVKKVKNVIKVFRRISEMLETYTHKKFNFQHYHETKMS